MEFLLLKKKKEKKKKNKGLLLFNFIISFLTSEKNKIKKKFSGKYTLIKPTVKILDKNSGVSNYRLIGPTSDTNLPMNKQKNLIFFHLF